LSVGSWPFDVRVRARLERIDEKLMWCVALLSAGPVVFSLTAPGFPDKLSLVLLLTVVALCVLAVYIGGLEQPGRKATRQKQ
jgi:hypothetical protein